MKSDNLYTHDCDKCRYLESDYVEGHEMVDWYVCVDHFKASLIGRYGSDGPDYWSMPVSLITHVNAESGTPMIQQALLVKERNL